MSTIKVVVAGINGRMGRASARAILEDRELDLIGAFGRAAAVYTGADIGELASTGKTGILVSSQFQDILAGVAPDVLLDFTEARAAFANARLALENGIRPVVGTSGLSEKEIQTLSDLAKSKSIGGMIVPNFSVGAVLMMEFARLAGSWFSHCEIIETHHTGKVDAPSGTALYTARKLGSTGTKFNTPEVEERELVPGARGAAFDSGVRVHSLRLPGLISRQEVIFGGKGELLTIWHDSTSTDCFLEGVVLALKSVLKLDKMIVGLEPLLLPGASI